MIKLLLTLAIAGLVSGCVSLGNKTQPVDIRTQEMERTRLELSLPEPISTNTIRWIVVTPDNIDSVWERFENDNQHLVLFAITSDGYERLSMSMSDIRNYIATQRLMIIKYQEYYEPDSQDE